MSRVAQLWLQCDRCRKWRHVKDGSGRDGRGIHEGEQWFCEYNSDKKHNSCDAREQTEDDISDGETTYQVAALLPAAAAGEQPAARPRWPVS